MPMILHSTKSITLSRVYLTHSISQEILCEFFSEHQTFSVSEPVNTFPEKLRLHAICCQTLGLVLRLRVDFVLPLSQEEQEQEKEEQQEQQEPPTKIYQKGEC